MNLIYINIYIDVICFEVFSVYNDKKNTILQNELKIPISFSMGDKLEYIRKFISIIIKQKKIEKAYLNINGKQDINTIKFEGALEDTLASYGVEVCS